MIEPDPAGNILLLRLEAPLMSFGGLAVDERRVTDPMPGLSLLTGLLANALGMHHHEGDALNRLQARLDVAVRRDRPGKPLRDYQTVDLGQDFLLKGWTTRGVPEGRGGASGAGTHIRLKDFWADAAYTVALMLHPADEPPILEELLEALRRPARPLFLGRKACLPSRPLVGGSFKRHEGDEASLPWPDRWNAPSPQQALRAAPDWAKDSPETCRLWWSAGPTADVTPPDGATRAIQVVDQRDWRHAIHAGQRTLFESTMPLPSSPESTSPPEISTESPSSDLSGGSAHA